MLALILTGVSGAARLYLASLVLRDLVGGVLAALLALAVSVPRLGDVDLWSARQPSSATRRRLQ